MLRGKIAALKRSVRDFRSFFPFGIAHLLTPGPVSIRLDAYHLPSALPLTCSSQAAYGLSHPPGPKSATFGRGI